MESRKQALIRIAQEHIQRSDETLSARQMAELRRLREVAGHIITTHPAMLGAHRG